MQKYSAREPRFWKKENNLIIYGIPFKEGEDTDDVLSWFLTVKLNIIGAPIYFTKAVRLGKPTKDRPNPPIKLNLVSESDKGVIYCRAHLFADAGLRIHDDLNYWEKWEKQTKMGLRNDLKKQGRRAAFRGKDLYVDNKLYC